MAQSVPCVIYRKLCGVYDLASSRDEFLHFETPYQILIATILSAQTTDRMVNQVTGVLFQKYPDPVALSQASIPDVENIIHSTGFYHAKARNIIGASQALVQQFGGEVPGTIEELVTIPGVGRKTANIVIHHAFGRAEGIAVDTHVRRLSLRLGLTEYPDPERIEKDLMMAYPKSVWGEINGLFILHGRRVCRSRSPDCEHCILQSLCPSARSEPVE